MKPRAALALVCSTLGLAAGSPALADEPHESASYPPDGVQNPEQQPASTPTPNRGETASEVSHVPPDPPQHVMGDMPFGQMAATMQMDDTARTGMVLVDQLEWRDSAEGSTAVWEAEGWYGGDYNKVWLRTEGERAGGTTQNAWADLLWDRVFARWWSVQAGARQDFGQGPARTWAALGVQGLAPYWFATEATFYVGDEGHTAVRLKMEYELLLTQRLILQPEGEADLYGKSDPARQLGSGLSDLEIGLRLRYEVRRQFAPYLGVVWSRNFGETADLVREAGGSASDVQFVAGVRAWF
jgi:copper resistance protein B